MQASTAIFLLIRSAHVLLAAIWVGATFLNTFFLFPSLQDTGPAGAPVIAAIMRRKLPAFMASLGGLAVVTGLYLYYQFTAGFDPAVSGSMAARVYGTGGLAGIIALVIGGAVVSRSAKKMGELGTRLATAPDSERAALASQMAAARQRTANGARFVIALQIVAVVLMAIGHYV